MSKFRMIGKDVDCYPEQYRVWVVDDVPDYTGEKYSGTKSGNNPLKNITAYIILDNDSLFDFNMPSVSDPNVRTWVDTKKSLPESIQDGQLAIIKNDIFIFGGKNSDKIYKSTINNPTKWEITKGKLPSKLCGSQLAIVNDRIYLFGGESEKCLSTIYSASINDPLTWIDHGSMLPTPIKNSQLAIANGYLYLFGGIEYLSSSNIILKAPISNPLLWQKVNKKLPFQIYNSCILMSCDKIYLFGGCINNDLSSVILSCDTNDPETWSVIGNMPIALSNAQAFTIADKLYLIAGNKDLSIYKGTKVSKSRRILFSFYENNNSSNKNDKAEIYESSIKDPTKWMRIKNKIPQNTLNSHLAFIYGRFFIFGGNGTKNIITSTYKAKIDFNDSDTKIYKSKINIDCKDSDRQEEIFKSIGFAPWKTDIFNK